MTTLFKKIQTTIETELQQLFEKKQEKNPLAALNRYIRQAEKKTDETGELVKRQADLKREMERQYEEISEVVAKRQQQLKLAQLAEDAELIAFAQQEVDAYESRQQALQETIDQANSDYFELEQKHEMMKHKIADMKVRQLSLMGKENVVRAQHKMDQLMGEGNVPAEEDLANYIDTIGKKIDHEHAISTYEARLAQLEKDYAKANLQKQQN